VTGSDHRHLIFGGPLVLGAGLAAGFLAGHWAACLLGMFLPILVDRVLIGLDGGLVRADWRLSLAVESAGVRAKGTVTHGVATVAVRLTNRSGRSRRLDVAPLVPPGMDALGATVLPTSLPSGERTERIFRFRITRVGVAVFPGAVIGARSPLGFSRRQLLLTDRQQISVFPDYTRSAHPVVARFLRSGLEVGERERPRAVKGAGTDFAEIREYRFPDSIRRVDWKATARRCRLMVREYEEPREFTIRVILDGSRDMTEGEEDGRAFARAADLVGKLAYVAQAQRMGMALAVYDRTILFERALTGSATGFRRLLADLVAVPRQALLRTVRAARGPAEVGALARRRFEAGPGALRGGDAREPLDGFLERYRRRETSRDPLGYLADFHPGMLAGVEERCPSCGTIAFADEPACPGCGGENGVAGLSPRAGCLAEVLTRALRRSRGREMLVLISPFRGGEACREVAGLLAVASTGHRKVHAIFPAHRPVSEVRASFPEYLGAYPMLTDSLADTEELYASAVFGGFTQEVAAAGVSVHPLADPAAMEGIVADLLLSEVLNR